MNALNLYHRLPGPLRTAAASLKGIALRHYRYGGRSDLLVQEALLRETWSQQEWQAWQRERLVRMLHHAATQVPYYREQWARRRRGGDRASWEDIESWPVLTKEEVRLHAREMVADECDVRRLHYDHTSGTTGKPLDIWSGRDTVRAWYALAEARWRRWYGVSNRVRWALVGGTAVVPTYQRRPPLWVWNAGMRQLYMSAYHLAPDLVPSYLVALRRYKIRILWGDAANLQVLAWEAVKGEQPDICLDVVITEGGPLFEHQRRLLSAAFHCPVYQTYGMSEKVAGASECAYHRMHLWPEAGWVEVMDDAADVAVPRGTAGRLVCTGLLNEEMPLIRYALGDRGRLPERETPCACGRTLPALESLEGRLDDLVVTPDGRLLNWLNPAFSHLPIREGQVIQETRNRFRVLYVPADGCPESAGEIIAGRVKEIVGPVEVVVQEVTEVPRGPNGKLRAVISQLSREEVLGASRGRYEDETDRGRPD